MSLPISFQQWITLRFTAGATGVLSFTQDRDEWVEVAGYADVALSITVTEVTLPGGGTVTLWFESAPTDDEMLFASAAPPIEFNGTFPYASPTTFTTKSVRALAMVPLARWLRWRVSVPNGSTGAWSITFRVHAALGKSRFFAPTDLSGCQLWARSDLGITKTGTAVSLWADQSGAGHDLIQTDSFNMKQPTWTPPSSVRGQPTINFDGVNDTLATSAFSMGVYTVLLVTSGQNATNGYFFTRSSGGVEADTLYGSVGHTTYINRGGTVSGYNNAASWGQWGATTFKLVTQSFNGTHAGHKVRINGVEQSWTSSAAGEPGTGTTNDQFVLAGRNDSATVARIAVPEVLLYNRALSNDELMIVEEYLRRRYGLY